MPLQLSDSCLVDAPVSDWKLAITESLHLCIYSMRGAIKWLVLDHHPNPWDVVCAVLYSNSKMLRCVTVSIIFHLHTSKWIYILYSRVSFCRDGKMPKQFDAETRERHRCSTIWMTVGMRGRVSSSCFRGNWSCLFLLDVGLVDAARSAIQPSVSARVRFTRTAARPELPEQVVRLRK